MAGFGSVGGIVSTLGGGAIGSAVVKLSLDSRQYQAQLGAAQGQTVASANAMGTGVSKFGALAGQSFLIAGAAAAAFAVSSVKAAIEANEAHIKLQNTFDNNVRLADQTVEAFEAQADAIRDLTGVDDELITSMQAVVGQFDLTGTQVMELTPLIVDLSEKMGVSLEAAAKAVGKATQGNTGSLARYGIQIDATSNEADAFAAVLDGLGVAAGFAAERAEAEPWRLLSAQFEEIQESVGQALLPLVQDLARAFTDALPAVEAIIGSFQFLTKISPGLIQLLGALSAVMERLPQLGLEEFNTQVVGIIGNAPAFAEGLTFMTDGVSVVGYVTEQTNALFRKFQREVADTQQRVANFAHMTTEEVSEFRESVIADFDQMAGGLTNLSRKWELTAEAAVKATRIIAERQDQIASDLRKLDQLDIGEGLKRQLLELGPDMVRAFISGNRNQREKIRENLRAYDEAIEETSDEVRDIAHKGGIGVGEDFVGGAIKGILNGSAALAQAAADAIHRAIAAARLAAGAKSPSEVMKALGRDIILGLIKGIDSEDENLVRTAERAIAAMTKAVERELAQLTRVFEKQISKLEGQLSQVQSRASSLRGAVTGGFSSFGDISGAFGLAGADIGGFFSSQVTGAQQFASVLQALQAQGASAGLLSQIASGGPEAIPFAQQLLQQGPAGIASVNAALQAIADLAGDTAKNLGEAYFGERIDELREELSGIRQELRDTTRFYTEVLRLLEDPRKLLEELRGLRRDLGDLNGHEHPGNDSEAMRVIHEGLSRRARHTGSLQLT